jgi:ribonuclease E
MTKRMLIDGTHPEEIRVVVTDGKQLDEYDVETSTKKQLKGNIYLAKVTRVEPSLQAAFVDYGGNRHGFLAFNEIHPDYYQIPVEDREALLAEQEEMELQAQAAQAHVDEMDGGLDDGDEDEADVAASDESEDEDRDESGGDDLPELADEFETDGAAPDTVAAQAESAGAPEPDVIAQPVQDLPETAGDADMDDETESAAGAEAQPIDPADAEQPDIPDLPEAAEAAGDGEPSRRRSPMRYKIQEVIKRRQILLVQVVKEERGNKGAALTTYISLAGRYSVLMPNTARGGGISRKITNATSRRKLRKILGELEIPKGMGVIMRTAGMERNKTEIKRDLDYLLRAWDEVRELTLQSTAPTLVYEEASLIKRAIRDLYAKDTEEILVDGADAYQTAKKFMRLLMPSHAKRVQPYRDGGIPLFFRYQVEGQLDAMHSPVVQLKSGGYIVIHSTEALVAIDVNSGRATRARNIEETAHRTNLEAAEEVARQLRLRDLAGLIVIDFIDMEDSRNIRAVERKMREAMKTDRARIQIGRISNFGLLELSRQRLRPSLIETSTEACPHCQGTGFLRSTESMAVHVLRAIEEEGIRNRSGEVSVSVATGVAIYILNQKRASLVEIEQRYGFTVNIVADDDVMPPDMRLERLRPKSSEAAALQAISIEGVVEDAEAREAVALAAENGEGGEEAAKRKPRRRRSRRKSNGEQAAAETASPDDGGSEILETGHEDTGADADFEVAAEEENGEEERGSKRRRRGRRGGRRRGRRGDEVNGEAALAEGSEAPVESTAPTFEPPAAEPMPDDVEAALETRPGDDDSEPVMTAGPEHEAGEDTTESPVDEASNDVAPPAPPAVPESPTDAVVSSDNANGESVADTEPLIPPETNIDAADRIGAPDTADVADVPPEIAADRPRRKGWWQKLVE